MIIKNKQSLKQYTTYRIGGTCELMVFPETEEVFASLPELIGDKPAFIMGNGSNVLFADRHFDAAFVNLTKWTGIMAVEIRRGESLQIKSGTPNNHLIKWVIENKIGGYAFLAGIPGTIGGAVCMNAGAWARYIGPLVQEVKVFSPAENKYKTYEKNDLRFTYRANQFLQPGEIISSVTLDASQPDDQVEQKVKNILDQRRQKHPNQYSCGSVFKNPPAQAAGQLIEACGLKGQKQGGAQISEKHANFIINAGSATFADVMSLIRLAQTKVKQQYGLDLEPEVKIIDSTDHPLFFRLRQ